MSDGYDDGGVAQADSLQAYLETFQQVGSQTLTDLIEKTNASDCPVDYCLVYDSVLLWGLTIARKFGLVGSYVSYSIMCYYIGGIKMRSL